MTTIYEIPNGMSYLSAMKFFPVSKLNENKSYNIKLKITMCKQQEITTSTVPAILKSKNIFIRVN